MTWKNQRLWVGLALLTVYLIWGSSFLAIRIAVETLPPFLMAGTRTLIAGAVLYAWRRAGGDAPPARVEWHSAILVGIFLWVGGNGGIVWAEQWITSSVAALLNSTVPLWLVILDAVRPSGQRPKLLSIVGLTIGFGGVAILVESTALATTTGTNFAGVSVLLASALSWSLGSLFARHGKFPDSPLLGTAMQLLAGGVGLLLVGIFSGEWNQLAHGEILPRSVFAWIYLTIFGSGVAYVAYTWLLRTAPLPLVSTYAYVNPIVATMLGYGIAAEPLTLPMLIATALIIGSVALTTVAHLAQ
jgi:drug/metabolite transporter (DMT)-like permease